MKFKTTTLLITALIFLNTFSYSQTYDIEPDLSNPDDWIVDVVHLGSKQVKLSYDATEAAAIFIPTWSAKDTESEDVAVSNLENGRLHIIQHIDISDCTQSEVHFEINIPQAYIDEGKMEFVFSLQAGAAGDYLFNGHTYTMSEFSESGGRYKKIIIIPSDYNEDLAKLRKIERINIIFERKGSVISAPIKIRKLGIILNEDKIIPPTPEMKVKNPDNYYKFTYNNKESIENLEVRVSNESMDIKRQLDKKGDGMSLVPQWKEGQVPAGHTGDVILVQQLGSPHDFEQSFIIEYLMNIPRAYFDEGKMQIKPFVQAGELGYYVWSGIARSLDMYADKAGQDVLITLSSEDFIINKQKKKNLIEMIGFGLDRHGSVVCDPIILKSITVRLPE